MREETQGSLLGSWLRTMRGCQGHSLRWSEDECGVVKLRGSGGQAQRGAQTGRIPLVAFERRPFVAMWV